MILQFDEREAILQSGPCQWAISELETCLLDWSGGADLGGKMDRRKVPAIHLTAAPEAIANHVARLIGADLPITPESFAIARDGGAPEAPIYVYACEARGVAYALTELAARVRCAGDAADPFDLQTPVVERAGAKVRSVSRCFQSVEHDLGWFHDRDSWIKYLTQLVTHRFNRLSLTFGMQYNYPYGNEFISDVYFYLAYPFLVSVPGYDVSAVGLSNAERAKNLKTLKFVAREARRRGLDFQLALWTQSYDFDDCPNANYRIRGLTAENRAAYCRDALATILREVPDISGLTLRVHVECGIPEGDYAFWRTYFEAVSGADRVIALDLHAKGIDDELIDIALATGMPLTISPKYMAEHMGLPYHQASIRMLERPASHAGKTKDTPSRVRDTLYSGADHERHAEKWRFSEGSRKFMRYSYGDLLREDRPYDLLFRIWPGTQRVLLWGDPALARGFGRNAQFCGAGGIELCEPLSFRGRMGVVGSGDRDGYTDRSLAPEHDWQKYACTYRIWGRSLYNPDVDARDWRRYMAASFGDAGTLCETALANASRILPLVTLVHSPTASNNSYWPEMYENMSVVREAPYLPYGYELDKPARFGTVGACDPQLFMSPCDFATALAGGASIRRFAPLTCANWLSELATNALTRITEARRSLTDPSAEFRRLATDVAIQGAIGRFFAEKIRSAVLWEFFLLTGEPRAALEAVEFYGRARDAWRIAADECKTIYEPDLAFGPHPWLRGRWDDRLPAIDADLADMTALSREPRVRRFMDGQAARAKIAEILAWSDDQRIACQHRPAAQFSRGQDLAISCIAGCETGHSGYLHYRHVDQSEDWLSSPLKFESGAYIGTIPAVYTDTAYPLQYYFEFEVGNSSKFFPGLSEDLSNDPYFCVRKTA